MRAAKMMCARNGKKPIAMKAGGNPVAKSLSSPALKPKVVKPKKGKGAYTRKGKSLPMSSGGGTKSKVNEAGNYTKPSMRKNLFNKIKAGGKGGKPGQWSARKAQMLAQQYKAAGGGYRD
jgi:stalled ribosome alternative rescue factor ArfA